jgi:hypothetical protein
MMRNNQFPERLTRSDKLFPIVAGSAAAAYRSAFRGTAAAGRSACCIHGRKGTLHISDLARRVAIADAGDNLAAQLGDGKETDGTTNRPYYQTNPALFAAPHFLSVGSEENFCVVEWIPDGRPRQCKYVRS